MFTNSLEAWKSKARSECLCRTYTLINLVIYDFFYKYIHNLRKTTNYKTFEYLDKRNI